MSDEWTMLKLDGKRPRKSDQKLCRYCGTPIAKDDHSVSPRWRHEPSGLICCDLQYFAVARP